MGRLIDADALIEHAELKEWGLTKNLWINAEVFRNAPTVDAVPVVRCKDCKRAEFSEAGMTYAPESLDRGSRMIGSVQTAKGKKMRLIDADALPIKFDGHTVSVWKNDIDNASTVDAVPVVRCKDCAHSSERELFPEDSRWKCKMAMGDEYHDGNFFCAWGERREDGKAD